MSDRRHSTFNIDNLLYTEAIWTVYLGLYAHKLHTGTVELLCCFFSQFEWKRKPLATVVSVNLKVTPLLVISTSVSIKMKVNGGALL